MFGVGGGIVKGPLMLHMGVHPFVASATCAVMIMFTSVAATTMFIAFGTLLWDYGIFLFIIGSIWRVYLYPFVLTCVIYLTVCLCVRVIGNRGGSIRSKLFGEQVSQSVPRIVIDWSRSSAFHRSHGRAERLQPSRCTQWTNGLHFCSMRIITLSNSIS